MGYLSDLFTKLFGGGSPEPAVNMADTLREYINCALPENYVHSRKYALSIQEMAGGYVAHVTLDMLADGSDYTGMDEQDLWNVTELESGYLLGSCLNKPPVEISYILMMVFTGGHIINVERRAGSAVGVLIDHGRRQVIHF